MIHCGQGSHDMSVAASKRVAISWSYSYLPAVWLQRKMSDSVYVPLAPAFQVGLGVFASAVAWPRSQACKRLTRGHSIINQRAFCELPNHSFEHAREVSTSFAHSITLWNCSFYRWISTLLLEHLKNFYWLVQMSNPHTASWSFLSISSVCHECLAFSLCHICILSQVLCQFVLSASETWDFKLCSNFHLTIVREFSCVCRWWNNPCWQAVRTSQSFRNPFREAFPPTFHPRCINFKEYNPSIATQPTPPPVQ